MSKGKYKIITAMLIFGSIGVFVKGIDLSSSEIAFLRGMIGSIFLIFASKFIKKLTGFETTLVQLLVAAVVLLPYVIIRDHLDFSGLNSKSILLLLILGIVHTGLAYFLYFSAVKDLKGQTIAVLSYIDPISAVVMAAVFLGESMSIIQIIGGVLILGSTFLSEKFERKISFKKHHA